MSLRIGERVAILAQVYKNGHSDPKESRTGQVLDLKWNLVLIRFEDGEQDWIDCRRVHVVSKQ